MYAENIVKEMKSSKQIAVFGAGIMALGVVNCLVDPPYQLSIICCLVSDKKKNPAYISKIPVFDFIEAKQILHRDTLIVIAAVDKNLDSMQKSLYQQGYHRTISLGYEGDLWSLIRGNYYREICIKQKKAYLRLEEELQNVDTSSSSIGNPSSNVRIYTACCHLDRKLKEDISHYFWETPIQVGAALTNKRICSVCDNVGENISEKNRQYCELTALYWIWKNDNSDYVGLGHYRRHFEVNKEMLEKLVYSDIDVVLTIPIFDYPSVSLVYARDHMEKDWQVMMKAIKQLCPEYMDAANNLHNGQFYYAYNMFIMRRRILEKYCSWLFPILSYCEKNCEGERNTYQDRYIGFLAEHLMTIYFLCHEKEYKIVHAIKHFIEI